jgi:hypothetical protein
MRADPTGQDYWLEGANATDQGGLGLHEKICVGKLDAGRFCISFADTAQGCLFNCPGIVYENSGGAPNPLKDKYRITDASVDAKIRAMLGSMIGRPGTYHVIGFSCRDFSEYLFKRFVSEYGGTAGAPPSPGGGGK